MERPRLVRLGPALLAPAAHRIVYLRIRLGSMVDLFRDGRDVGPSVAFRLRESARLVELLADSTGRELLLGRGLGATYPLHAYGYDAFGNQVFYERPSYIHNYYLFLLFKLGLVGTLMVLAALFAWWLWSFRAAVGRSPVGDRSLCAALSAAVLAYAVWCGVAPECVDFRVAPIWGLILATSCATVHRPSSARGR